MDVDVDVVVPANARKDRRDASAIKADDVDQVRPKISANMDDFRTRMGDFKMRSKIYDRRIHETEFQP